jgi:hypothetical protein
MAIPFGSCRWTVLPYPTSDGQHFDIGVLRTAELEIPVEQVEEDEHGAV